MSLFKKKEKIPEIPTASSLPSLPALPPLESADNESSKRDLPELPSFPASSKNEDFNQEMVKSAVSDVSPLENEESYSEIPSSIQVEEMPEERLTLLPKVDTGSSIPELPELPESATSISQQRVEPERLEAPIIPTAPEPSVVPTTPTQFAPPRAQSEKQNEPIFVRIDKFQSAQKNFDEIKSKVAEIESILQNLKNVKSQEEEELKGWSEDTEKLKSRLAEIDGDLFGQL